MTGRFYRTRGRCRPHRPRGPRAERERLLRELARRGLTDEQLARAAAVDLDALRGWVESERRVDA
jgi:hypothetical protein